MSPNLPTLLLLGYCCAFLPHPIVGYGVSNSSINCSNVFYSLCKERLKELGQISVGSLVADPLLFGPKDTPNVIEKGFASHVSFDEITLINSGIKSVHSEAFDPSTESVSKLDLSFNQLSDQVFELVIGMDNISHLSLKGNQIETLPENVFRDLQDLVMIDLSDNLISELGPDALKFPVAFGQTVEVHLENNSLVSFNKTVFKPFLTQNWPYPINHLYLNDNPIACGTEFTAFVAENCQWLQNVHYKCPKEEYDVSNCLEMYGNKAINRYEFMFFIMAIGGVMVISTITVFTLCFRTKKCNPV